MPKRAGHALKALALVFLLGIALAACGGGGPPAPTPAVPEEGPAPEGATQLTVRLSNYKFTPATFTFRVGEAVDFILTSTDIIHTFTVDDLDINWSVEGRKTRRHLYTFTSPGRFRLYCDIPGHKELGMVGTIEVR